MGNISRPMIERFWLRVQKTDTCWIWTGAKTGSGYGVITGEYNSATKKCPAVLAHRYSYLIHNGELPEELDHVCFNTDCVNPHHLEAVTHAENMRRSDMKRGIRSAKTHCPKGHPYSGKNLFYRASRNRRECRTCINARAKRRREV